MDLTRFERQADLIPMERLRTESASVIGLGAIGRPLVEGLAAIGIGTIHLFDFDNIDATNITTQGYKREHIDKAKNAVMMAEIASIDETIITTVNDRWEPKAILAENVFVCVDSITTREAIWKDVREKVKFLCDGRMLGLAIRILSAWTPENKTHYDTTLFAASEAEPGRCTARSAIWPARLAASLMINQFVQYLNGAPPRFNDILLNLASYDFTPSPIVAKPTAAPKPKKPSHKQVGSKPKSSTVSAKH